MWRGHWLGQQEFDILHESGYNMDVGPQGADRLACTGLFYSSIGWSVPCHTAVARLVPASWGHPRYAQWLPVGLGPCLPVAPSILVPILSHTLSPVFGFILTGARHPVSCLHPRVRPPRPCSTRRTRHVPSLASAHLAEYRPGRDAAHRLLAWRVHSRHNAPLRRFGAGKRCSRQPRNGLRAQPGPG